MEPVIEARNVKKYFTTPSGLLHAVDDLSLKIYKGRTLGVVGESGCGKSTLGRTIIHLQDSTAGQILLNGKDITGVRGRALRNIREKMQIVFQDPYSSIDPRKTIRDTVREPLKVSRRYSRAEIERKTAELMELVGIDERLCMSYPHELDGGRRQRVGIARALALEPEFIVCDEPVSALDVSIQAQVLNLLKKLQQEKQLTYMFITHDLSVVRHISHDICVMYLGQAVETCPSKELFKNPLHPYTKALFSAIPSVDFRNPSKRIPMRGEITSPINPKPGCRFAARCPYVAEKCYQPQQLVEVLPNHFVKCCRVNELGV